MSESKQAPKQHAKGGSITNMPTQAEVASFEKNVKPGLVSAIQKNWGQIMRKARSLNGAIRFHDKAT
jgi:hypothetical protein